MTEPVATTALIVAIFSGFNSLFNTIHIRKCKILGCINSDCSKTPPNSPAPERIKDIKEITTQPL